MQRTDQKRVARQKLSIENRHSRFISEYVKSKHTEIYNEAEAFFKHVQELNPNKRDLTKTHQFLVATTGFVDRNDFYNRKRQKAQEKNQQVNDNMVLRVQLLAPEAVTTINHNSEPLVIPGEQIQIRAVTTCNHNSEPLVIPGEQIQIGAVTTSNHNSEPLVIPDGLYEDLIKELRSDPDLHAILNDMNMDMDPDISFDEQTPLERELDELGF